MKTSKSKLHVDEKGRARMVDVSAKKVTRRLARAEAAVKMNAATLEAITKGLVKKGDVLAIAQVAGVMAVKRTPDIIPLCHPLEVTSVDISFRTAAGGSTGRLIIESRVSCRGRTGVEMEAMTGAAAAALTVYDMVKALDRWAVIEEIKLLEKSGGSSGHLKRR